MLDLPVADPWFVVHEMGHGIRLISEPHVHPMMRCNVWHVAGRSCDLVVDTSLGLSALRPQVQRRGQRGLLAVATHTHADHVGSLHEFERRAVHRAEAATLEKPASWSVRSHQLGPAVLEPYLSAGYVIDELLLDAVPTSRAPSPGTAGSTGTISEVMTCPPAPAGRLLEEGDVIDLGDRQLEVLHLPGHSPGSIGLWEPARGVLFSGDAIYDGPLLDELDGSDIAAYCASLRRLQRLPVEVVHGGHEASFGRDRLNDLCESYLRRRDRAPGAGG